MKQMDATGPIFAFEVEGRAQAHGLLDALTLIDISNNIGDARSLMTHPASTTHAGVSEDVRHDMGVSEGMLRLNVGLEDVRDLIDDRSEEHTSELQSLMRISYAVFCLKQKKNDTTNTQ